MAVDHCQGLTRSHAYVMKLDIAGYFPSTHQEVLQQQLARRMSDARVRQLFATILGSYWSDRGPSRGLPCWQRLRAISAIGRRLTVLLNVPVPDENRVLRGGS